MSQNEDSQNIHSVNKEIRIQLDDSDEIIEAGDGAFESREKYSPNGRTIRRSFTTERELSFELFKVDAGEDSLVSDAESACYSRLIKTEKAYPSSNASEKHSRGTYSEPNHGLRTSEDNLLGTVSGVFLPCLQNILGVILFIRLSWIVGQAGVLLALTIVIMCCTCTTLTGLSLSAVATNGAMKGGGPYFLIGRALGPELGTSIGICFYLGTTIAASMYILGGVETMFSALPSMRIFTDSNLPANQTDLADMRVIGTIVAFVILLLVSTGTKNIARVGPLFLIPVLISIVCILLGIWIASESTKPNGVTGLKANTLSKNMASSFVRTDSSGDPRPFIGTQVWSFQALLALFFPSVTGIMAGSNRSAMLKDPQKSIPVGTLSAIGITSVLYTFFVIMYGGVASRRLLLHERLISAEISWPEPTIVRIGIILSTLGAALQSMTSAPRLLQAMANDGLVPFLHPLKSPDTNEPYKCLVVTFIITLAGVLVGRLDLITPIITQFFLMCYFGVNAACFLLDFMKSPNWRPRWQYHSEIQSFLGASLCITIMILISWIFTVIAMAGATLIYLYVAIYGAPENWGDGLKNVRFRNAITSLVYMKDEVIHPKNWYPSPLIFCKPWGLLPDSVPCHPKLIAFANMLKIKGQGLSMIYSIIEGNYSELAEEAYKATKELQRHIDDQKCEGFAEVVVARTIQDGFRGLLQSAGVGGVKPNLVVMRYPEHWRNSMVDSGRYESLHIKFTSMLKDSFLSGKGIVLIADADKLPHFSVTREILSFAFPRRRSSAATSFPPKNKKHNMDPSETSAYGGVNVNNPESSCNDLTNGNVKASDTSVSGMGSIFLQTTMSNELKDRKGGMRAGGTIDLYWVVRDGGLMLLLAQVLMRSTAFKSCTMRVFVVSDCTEKSVPLKRDVEKFLYELRMVAEVVVLVLDDDKSFTDTSKEKSNFHDCMRFILDYHKKHPQKETGIAAMDYACSPIPQTLHKRKETASHQSNNGNANIHHSDSHASGISAEELKRIERSILLSIKINKLVRDNSCVKNLETGECASMILLSLPPPPENHPALNYMTYLDMIIEGITSPMLLVRGYRRQVLTLYT